MISMNRETPGLINDVTQDNNITYVDFKNCFDTSRNELSLSKYIGESLGYAFGRIIGLPMTAIYKTGTAF